MKRFIDQVEKKKVKATPEVTKLWGTTGGRAFAKIYMLTCISSFGHKIWQNKIS